MRKFRWFRVFAFVLAALTAPWAPALSADSAVLQGKVVDADTGDPLPGANVFLVGTSIGSAAGEDGTFKIVGVPPGRYTVRASMIGYRSVDATLNVSTGRTYHLDFELHPITLRGKTIVVTGTRTARYVKDTPVYTEVVTTEEIRRRNPRDFLEATRYVGGVDPQVECSICNTSSISIHGMPGRYTQVLVDGIPLFGSLGQVYGYMQIPPSLISQMEVVKGSSSVLYGSDAIAGIVNIRTREPHTEPEVEADVQFGSYGERRLGGVASYRSDALGLVVNGEYYGVRAVDRNGDGITEFTGTARTYMNAKMHLDLGPDTKAHVRASGLQERRQGGAVSPNGSFIETIDVPDWRAFSESILTERNELTADLVRKFHDGSDLAFRAALTRHFQDSDYEGFVYVGKQWLGYAETQWNRPLNGAHQVTAGAAYRWEKLEENAAIMPYDYRTVSVFAQDDWQPSVMFETVVGLRWDYHNVYKHILTPSFTAKWQPTAEWTTRFTLGRGFRAPTAFYELDHGTGAKYKYNTKYLAHKAEQAWSATLSLSYDRFDQRLTTSVFWHHLDNYIAAHNDPVQKAFIVENVEKPSTIVGSEVSYNRSFANGVSLTFNYIFEHYSMAPGTLGFARPEQRFKWTFDYAPLASPFRVSLDGEVTGPMKLREVYGLAYNADGSVKMATSPWYAVVNAEVAREIGGGVELSVGVRNLLDFNQSDVESPLMYDAQGNLGDVIYVWGPLLGRQIVARMRVSL